MVLLKTGFLPDTKFLQNMKSLGEGAGQFLEAKQRAALVHRSNDPGAWLGICMSHPGSPELFPLLQEAFDTQTVPSELGRLYEVQGTEQIARVEDLLFQSLVKDTEGFMSKHVERKISIAISRRIVNTSVTPNQMTVLSALVGLAGALLMGMGPGGAQVAGALLFLAHSILDGCDGELARIKFLQSRWGGLLDYWSDNLVHSAVFFALAFEWSRRTGSSSPFIFGGLAIFGTLASASWIYWNTMREKPDHAPLYTSVSTSENKSQAVRIADFLSRRDFIYLVILLALFQKLDWFLVLSAIGAPAFFLILVWIHYSEKNNGMNPHGQSSS